MIQAICRRELFELEHFQPNPLSAARKMFPVECRAGPFTVRRRAERRSDAIFSERPTIGLLPISRPFPNGK